MANDQGENRDKCLSIIRKMKDWAIFYARNNIYGKVIALYTQNQIYGGNLDPIMAAESVAAMYSQVDSSLGNTNYLAPIRDFIVQRADEYGLGFSIQPNGDASLTDAKALEKVYSQIMYDNELDTNWRNGIRYILDYGYYGLLLTKKSSTGSNLPKITSLHPLNCFWDIAATGEFKQFGKYCGFSEKDDLEKLCYVYKNNKELRQFYQTMREKNNKREEKYMQLSAKVITFYEKSYTTERYLRYNVDSIYDNYASDDDLKTILDQLTIGDFENTLPDVVSGMLTFVEGKAKGDQQFAPMYRQFVQEIGEIMQKPIEEEVVKHYIEETVFLQGLGENFIILRNDKHFAKELPLIFCGTVTRTPLDTHMSSRQNGIISDNRTVNATEEVISYFAKIIPTILILNRIETALVHSLKRPPFLLVTAVGLLKKEDAISKPTGLQDIENCRIIELTATPEKPLSEVFLPVQLPNSTQELLASQQVYMQKLNDLMRIRTQDNATPQDPRSNLAQVMRVEQAQDAIKRIHAPMINAWQWCADIIKNALPDLHIMAGIHNEIYQIDKYNISVRVTGGSLMQDDYESNIIKAILSSPLIQQDQLLSTVLHIEELKKLKSVSAEQTIKFLMLNLPAEVKRFFDGRASDQEMQQWLQQRNEEMQKQAKPSNETKIADATLMTAQTDQKRQLTDAENKAATVELKKMELGLEQEEVKIKQQEADTKETKAANENITIAPLSVNKYATLADAIKAKRQLSSEV